MGKPCSTFGYIELRLVNINAPLLSVLLIEMFVFFLMSCFIKIIEPGFKKSYKVHNGLILVS